MIAKILDLLSPPERRQAYWLLVMILVMAFLDVVGVASIMPFMAVLANPTGVQANPWLATAYTGLNFTDPGSFLFFLGLVVFAALVLSIGFKALTTWALLHFTQMRNHSLSQRLVAGYLRQPYEWFLNRHSADLGMTVLSEVQLVISNALMPLLQMLAQGAVVIALLALLIVADPLLALAVSLVLGLSYGGIYTILRRRLVRLGEERVVANESRFQILTEAFGGIKEVKIAGLEDAFFARFDGPSERFARAQVFAAVVGQLPRYALEMLAFGGMLLVMLYLMQTADGLHGALPIIALYAFAAYRLMPALQQFYSQLTQLRFGSPAVDSLHRDLVGLAPQPVQAPAAVPLLLARAITLEGITYAYPKAPRAAVRGLNLEIPAFTTVGLVGATGSGKTTTVDIILGLLEPQAGRLRVDGAPITAENRRGWQRNLGYVPQQIFLADDTVAANIAFGMAKDRIDQVAVERAARIANLHDFVSKEMPQGYGTLVGERGVRLSGGQRQRIGIAQALYHRPQVLILDEATSALDNLTEQVVMEAVHALGREITIILIAHRLTTVRECDCIYLLEKGKLVGQGTYEELVAGNDRFRGMARAAGI